MISFDEFSLFYNGFWIKKNDITWIFPKTKRLFLFSFLVSVLAGSAVISLCIWQTYIIITGQTTIEFYRNQVSRALLDDFVNPVNILH